MEDGLTVEEMLDKHWGVHRNTLCPILRPITSAHSDDGTLSDYSQTASSDMDESPDCASPLSCSPSYSYYHVHSPSAYYHSFQHYQPVPSALDMLAFVCANVAPNTNS